MICKQFSQSIIYHYMDDILLVASDTGTLERMFNIVQKTLHCWGLQI